MAQVLHADRRETRMFAAVARCSDYGFPQSSAAPLLLFGRPVTDLQLQAPAETGQKRSRDETRFQYGKPSFLGDKREGASCCEFEGVTESPVVQVSVFDNRRWAVELPPSNRR